MTTTTVDVIILVIPAETSSTIDFSDKEVLEKNLDFKIDKKKVELGQHLLASDTIELETVIDKKTEFDNLTSEVQSGLNVLLKELESRGTNLIYFFNKDEEVQLSEYILDMYDGASGDRITFQMYKDAIDYLEKLDRELGKRQGAGINY